MIRSLLFVTLAAVSVVQSEALAQAQAQAQPFGSRRSFVGKLVTAGAVVVTTAASNPAIASADAKPTPTPRQRMAEGKEMVDATHNGTELNGKQSGVASGLLGKMGIDDITPDKGSQYNNKGAQPTATQAANEKK